MKRGLHLLAWLCVLWSAAGARADTYEWQRTERLIQTLGLEPAALPEGRPIAWVRVVSDDVFVKDEVWPTLLNWFHATTREEIVRRELLFATGEPYSEARAEESMRNLRGMTIFALVRIVPVAVPGSRELGVLVHTRDLWSLRLETGFNITTFVDQLLVRGTERNFLGRNKTLGVDLTLVPQSYSLSQLYFARRVWGSAVSLTERAGVILNRETARPEGSLWLLQVGQPFYNLRQRYAWRGYVAYDNYVARRRSGKEVRTIASPSFGPDLPDPKLAWRQRDLLANLYGSVRLGDTIKHTFSLGWDVRSVRARAIGETGLVPELEELYARRVFPLQRTEIGPMASYDLFSARFVTFENLATFGQSENVRVGPMASLSTRLPLRAFASSSDSWVLSAATGITYAPYRFLIDVRVEGRARLEHARLVDQRLELMMRGATPVLLRAFRLVARMGLEARREDLANTFVALGASNGLRGYVSQQLGANGASRFLTNVELRTLPIEWQAVHVGAVAFYDVGTVYGALEDARLYHAVGAGLRVLFPQLNRTPFSFDGGFSWDPGFRFVPTVQSAQVVPMTAAEDPE